MQVVSSAFQSAAAAAARQITHGLLISWPQTINASTSFFTINSSHIGGSDIIKGAGGAVTFFDKYQFTNESQYVQSWTIKRQLSQQPYGVIMAQATVVLDNTSRRFLPNYDPTIGAYILPNRPIKIAVGFNGESIQQFVGYTGMPIQNLVARTTTITAFDAMSYLDGIISSSATFVNYTADQIIVALLQEAGFSSTQYSIETSAQNPISYYNPNGRKMTDIFNELCQAEAGLMFVDENGIITFWNRQHMNNNATSRWTFNYSNLTDIKWDTTPVINSVQVNASPLKVMAKTKLWENGQTIQLQPNTTTDVIANFQDDIGAFPAVSVDTPVYVAGATTSQYTTNLNSDGSGDPGNGSVSVSSVFLFGNSYRTTFTNTSAQIVYITKMELWGVPAKVQVLDTQTTTDTTSIAKYGINPNDNGVIKPINNNAIQDSSAAAALGYILVNRYNTPMARLIMPAFAVPQLQIGDKVTVNVADGAQTLTPYVVGLSLKLDGAGNLTQEVDAEQVPTYNYFTINVSTIGGSDHISP